jgi:hypothetical protein
MPLTRLRARGTLVIVSLVVLAYAAPLAQSAPHSRFFLSPSHNLSCELDVGRAGIPDEAYCQSFVEPSSVTLHPNGTIKVCRGTGCLGNPPERDATLAYGKAASLGPFRCVSSAAGITCRTRKGGFAISRSAVVRVAGTS